MAGAGSVTPIHGLAVTGIVLLVCLVGVTFTMALVTFVENAGNQALDTIQGTYRAVRLASTTNIGFRDSVQPEEYFRAPTARRAYKLQGYAEKLDNSSPYEARKLSFKIDGEEVNDGDRILLAQQDNPTENGIYVKQGDELFRASDMERSSQFSSGLNVFIAEGQTLARSYVGTVALNAQDNTARVAPDPISGFGIKFFNLNQIQLGAENAQDGFVPTYNSNEPTRITWRQSGGGFDPADFTERGFTNPTDLIFFYNNAETEGFKIQMQNLEAQWQINTAANTSGLTGGGDLTAPRDLSVDIQGTTATLVAEDNDLILIYDTSDTALKSITRANLLGGTDPNEFSDALFRVFNTIDNTKKLAFDCVDIDTGTTRTATWPNTDTYIPGITQIQAGYVEALDQSLATTDTVSFTQVTVGNTGLIVGSSTPFSDAAGTLTFQNVDAVDATTVTTFEAALTIDQINGWVSNENIDHSAVNIATAAGTSGLTGGGDITVTRNLSVDILGTTLETTAETADLILMYDNSAGALKRITLGNVIGGVSPTAFSDADFRVFNAVDNTKVLAFDCVDIATGTTRTATWPNVDTYIPGITQTQAGYVEAMDQSVTTTDTVEFSRLGLGTSTVPHGGVGWAIAALNGAVNSSDGPHMQYTVDTDNFPVRQDLNFSHDNISMTFDAFYDGSWKSSDAGSNFLWLKQGDRFSMLYDTGVAAGGAVTWNTGWSLSASTGYVGIGVSGGPNYPLEIVGGSVSIDNASGYRSKASGGTSRNLISSNGDDSVAIGDGSGGSWTALRFFPGGSETMRIIPSFVGINDTTPTFNLDVNGTFRVTGTAQFDDTVVFDEISANKIGVGTTTIPHGGVGWASLALNGPSGSSNGPHVQFTTDDDDFPVRQDLNWSHDFAYILFNAYWNGSWRSSDAGSNYSLEISSNVFHIRYDSGVVAGGVVNWNDGIIMNTSGQVGINETNPASILHCTSGTYPVFTTERTTSSTNTTLGAGRFLHTTTSNMVDGFGSSLHFSIQDNANVVYDMGYIGGVRTGADNSGSIQFATVNAGSQSVKMAILPDGGVGIGTTTVPHGGIGAAKLAIEGINAEVAAGPHVQVTTNADNYPLLHMFNFRHDNINMAFDAFYDGVWTSSYAGSNFYISKFDDRFEIRYDSGVAQGAAITWNNGIALLTSGFVGIGLNNPAYQLHVHENSTATSYISVTNSSTGTTSSDGLQLGIDSAHSFLISRENTQMDFYTNNTLYMTLTNNGKLGLGTTTVPHEGIGWAKFALEGTANSSDGPHVQITTNADNYPVFQLFVGNHDDQGLIYDAYFDGSWRSSDVGSNFAIKKASDTLEFRYDSGVAQGGVVTWNNSMVLDAAGNINIPNGGINVGWEGVSTNQIHIKSTGDASIKIEADTDNVGEEDNPSLILSQDGDLVVTKFGMNGSAGVTYSGANDNSAYVVCEYNSGAATSGCVQLGTNSIIRMTVDQNGRVGIGNTSPSSTTTGLTLQSSGSIGSAFANRNNNYLNITDGTTRMILDSNELQVVNATQGDTLFVQSLDTAGNTLFQFQNGGVSIGRRSNVDVPIGGVGAAVLVVTGTDGDVADGPHVQYNITTDNYPVRQDLNFRHDDMNISFDSYYDGVWRSSDLGSNFQFIKGSDTFRIRYDSGVAQGAALTWKTGFTMDTSGDVTFGNDVTVTNDITAANFWGPFPSSVTYVTAAGSSSVVFPAGTKACIVELQAGGGGGGGPGNSTDAAGGGGGGSFVTIWFTATDLSGETTFNYVVGAGGAGGTGLNNGVDGGNSTLSFSVGPTLIATTFGGQGGRNGNAYGLPGLGGDIATVVGGYVSQPSYGQTGSQGHDAGTVVTNYTAGSGGNSRYGRGGQGAGDFGGGAPSDGTLGGGGGGGAIDTFTHNGADGGDGFIRILWFS